jgi:hypothetical protein
MKLQFPSPKLQGSSKPQLPTAELASTWRVSELREDGEGVLPRGLRRRCRVGRLGRGVSFAPNPVKNAAVLRPGRPPLQQAARRVCFGQHAREVCPGETDLEVRSTWLRAQNRRTDFQVCSSGRLQGLSNGHHLKLGSWSFSGAWSLEFGVSLRPPRSLLPTTQSPSPRQRAVCA